MTAATLRRDHFYAAVLSVLIIAMPAHFGFGNITLTAADALLPVAILIAAVPVLKAAGGRFGIFALSYVVLVAISALANAQGAGFSVPAFWVQLLKNLVSIAYFLVFIALVLEARGNDRWMDVLFIVAAGASTIALIRVFVLNLEPRAYFPFLNPNAFAAFLALPFFILTFRMLFSPVSLWRIACLALIVLGILATGSRGGMGGMALGLVVSLAVVVVRGGLTRSFIRRAAILVAIGIVGAAAVLSYEVIDPSTAALRRLSDVERFENASALRLAYWNLAIDLFQSRPIAGVGLGQFQEYSGVLGKAFATHNTYLSFAVELGILGLAAWVLLLLAVFYRAASAPQLTPLVVALVGYVVAAAIQAGLNNTENLRVLWLGFAIVVAHPDFTKKILESRFARSISVRAA